MSAGTSRMRWGADLTSHHHHLRTASEEEAERGMRERYPGAVAIFVLLEESSRQGLSRSSGPVE